MDAAEGERGALEPCSCANAFASRHSARVHCPPQAALRSKLGEGTTAFERITDGSRTVSAGDVVRINVKPLLVGRVVAFTIPQVGPSEGQAVM